MFELAFAVVVLASFLLGSLPTAFLLVQKTQGKDLRREGSGNIGALNAYEVSGSRRTGLAVLGIDFAKGALAVLLARWLTGDYILTSAALCGAVLGHNYSPWIGFKGGRGLATAAGGAAFLDAAALVYWVALWLAARALSKDVHVGNIAATLLAPLAVLLLPGVNEALSWFPDVPRMQHVATALILYFIIFLRHIRPLRDLLRRGKSKGAH